ncbi:LANO_0G18448g1_1 [Lachancea nothofagi CBS 11611]|uniref:LANO_0G18448g1_1 n=1 Tax=Lachancea nothofagi CBS 11611 TaxID=1266666 RepID=A0A1G4KKL2_9SACH|nr:LANO_0G18448g1_1 [Lachancea nothofagi CBS 11611]
MTGTDETNQAIQHSYVTADFETKNGIVDEGLTKESSDEYILPDKAQLTKSLVIRKAELMAKQYDTVLLKSLFLFAAFICSFGYGLDGNIRSIYMNYAMNSYESLSLISTIEVVSSVMSAISQIFFAGLSDVFGRLSLFIVSIVFYVVGTVIQCQAYNVQRYAAGSVFYSIGLTGVMLELVLILSDNSSLKWRLFYIFVPAWPAIITTWVSGNVVDAATPENNWSWDIAMWAFIFPLTCVPLIGCMLHMRWKVRNDPEWIELQTENSFYQTHGLIQTLVQLFWKLDIVGLLLFAASIGCILVPLTLAGGYSSQWQNPKIIAPFVVGFVLALVFIYWESKLALLPFAPFRLLKDRGVWAALWINFLVCFIYAMACGYLYPILIIGMNQTDLSATRISSLYSFVAAIFSPFMGFAVTRSSRLKPYLLGGCSLYFVTMGLFYYYRGDQGSAKGIIGAMIVWGFASCMLDYPVNVSLQSVTSHEHMATVTALGYTIFSIGGAVAAAVSGAIWTQLLYPKLVEFMGDTDLAEAAYSSPYDFINDYPWGTPMRTALVEAYKHVQKYEVIVALVFTAPMLFLTFCLRDPELGDDVAQKLDEGEYVNAAEEDPIGDWISSRFSKLRRRG